MPEGDTLFRTAVVLREALVGKEVLAARGRPDGVKLGMTVGSSVAAVTARGKHLLIDFSNGLTLHTHLRMHGSWHRYRPGERWRETPARAVAVIEVPGAVAVCFDAPTVELMDTRAVSLHRGLTRLGPDLAASDAFEADAAFAALRDPSRATTTIGDALLDQRALAGLGNVYRSELCFLERLDPFTPVADVGDATLRRLIERAARLVQANARGGARVTTAPGTPTNVYVYGRTGRPCIRCGTRIQSRRVTAYQGANPRTVYWCPSCQR